MIDSTNKKPKPNLAGDLNRDLDKDIVLAVNNLRVSFSKADTGTNKEVVHGVSFAIKSGKVLALVGESGSGKSVTAMALIRLLPANTSQILADSIILNNANINCDLTQLTAKQMLQIRAKEIGVVFQDPMTSLNPVQKLGKQVIEVFALHRNDLTVRDYKNECVKLFDLVGIRASEQVFDSYPHQISGGMRQRVVIAIAIAAKPKILIADEPTTSLDVTVQSKILALLQQLQIEYNMSMLFISHDLAVVRAISDDIAVMYQGNIVEKNTSLELINNPKHAYTKRLLADSKFVN